MGQQRSLIILGLAIVLGLAAMYLANIYLGGSAPPEPNANPATVRIAVARLPLEFGAQVTQDKVRMVDWPATSVPAGAIRTPGQLNPMGKPRVAIRAMEANEPILLSKLSGEGGRATITALLRPEMRAAAVRVSDVAAAGGFVLPGDTVDVLITRTIDTGNGATNQITDVLLQGVRVLAIDQNASDTSDKPQIAKTATLEVGQVDAQKLALAQSVGALTLVLRKLDEAPMESVGTIGTRDLRDGAYTGAYSSVDEGASYANYTPPAEPRQRPARRRAITGAAAGLASTASVEVIRGVAGSNYEVKRYGER